MKRWLLLLAVSLAWPAPQATAQHVHAGGERLGEVRFATSCSRAAQPEFDRAVALMHSFQFRAAIEGFQGVLAKDRSCGMAYWGIALSDWGNPFAASVRGPEQLKRGSEAVAEARRTGLKTERERAYLDAVSLLYDTHAQPEQRARMLAYQQAMEKVSSAHPEDTEAAIFYALALAAAADPADKSFASQRKAGAILEALFARYPNHPGLAHYIIHAYDVPPLAEKAAEAARRYSAIAPSTPHALHMPSHTYTRLGQWDASIAANLESAQSARAVGQPAEELHASDYLVYAYLQTGQDQKARQVVESVEAIFRRFDPAETVGGAAGPPAAYFARAAIPARYCLERRDWNAAARLEVHSSTSPEADAITYFARGLGAAHNKDADGMREAAERLREMRERLRQSGEAYWANQVEIERQEIAAWQAYAANDLEGAIAGMREAALAEDQTEKNVVTPGPLAPAREQLAEMLLAAKRPAEARSEFEATLRKEPNRLLTLYGAAQAAQAQGDDAASAEYLRKLAAVTSQGDRPGRHEIAEAREHLQVQ